MVRPFAERLDEAFRRDFRHRIELGAIAGRQQDAAIEQVSIDEALDTLPSGTRWNECLFPDRDRRRLLVEADDDELHVNFDAITGLQADS